MIRSIKIFLHAMLLLSLIISVGSRAAGQKDEEQLKAWNQPVTPFKIIDNLYYIGAAEVASYLITTPKGHIILDSGFAETVPLIKENLTKLGFKLSDVKILINSHAHYDHAGGLALLKELTGAKMLASEADAVQLNNGGKNDFQWGDKFAFKPVKVDETFQDNAVIELGGVKLTAHLTPGHTKGCTSWTMTAREHGKAYQVVIIGSTTAPGYQLINNKNYPNIIADYQHTFQLLKSLPCDIFLAPHGSFFALKEKLARLKEQPQNNPFIDPQAYRDFLAESEEDLLNEKEKQAKALK